MILYNLLFLFFFGISIIDTCHCVAFTTSVDQVQLEQVVQAGVTEWRLELINI